MRNFIQSKLNEIDGIDAGEIISDSLLEEKITYFGYSLSINHQTQNTTIDNKNTYMVSIIGFVERIIDPTENTLEIVDGASKKIIDKLKEINIKCSSQDISDNDNIKKSKITGYGYFNEINNKFVN